MFPEAPVSRPVPKPALSLLRPLFAAAAVAAGAAAAPYSAGKLLCRFADPKITESSGLAASSRSGDYFWTHNDSGGDPQIFAVGKKGETLATLTVAGAKCRDWEDMALDPSDPANPALVIGDIGDNMAARPHVTVYRIREPEVDASSTGVKGDTDDAAKYDLEYEDGPHDAETLLVHPGTGRVYIVTKALSGSNVYVAPIPLRAGGVNRLRKIGAIQFAGLPGLNGGIRTGLRRLLATGGAISPDGSRLVVRTYTDAYEWPITAGDVAGALRKKPVRVPLPQTKQGEAITYSRDGRSLLTTTEGLSAAVHELIRQPG